MRKLFFLFVMAFALFQSHAQFIHKIKADSVLITNDSCTAELNLENSTKHIKGFLYNKGNGRTEFRKAEKLNDSMLLFGEDTVVMRGGSLTLEQVLTNGSDLSGNHTININNHDFIIKGTSNAGYYYYSKYDTETGEYRYVNKASESGNDSLIFWSNYDNAEIGILADKENGIRNGIAAEYNQAQVFAQHLGQNKISSIQLDTGKISLQKSHSGLGSGIVINRDSIVFYPTSQPLDLRFRNLPQSANISDTVLVLSGGAVKTKTKQAFAQSATVSLSGTLSEATLAGAGEGTLTIPSAAWTAGKSWKVTVYGVYSTSAGNPANLTLRLKLGTVTIATTGTIFLGSAKSDIPFTLQATITCRSSGSSGTVVTFGNVFRDGNVHSISNGTSASTINMTASQALDVTAQLSDTSTGNSVSAFIITLEAIN